MAKKSGNESAIGDGNSILINGSTDGERGDADSGAISIAGIPIAALPGAGTGVDSGGDTPRRGRGRPSGSAKRPAGKRVEAAPSSVKGIEKILFSIHAMAAAATGIDELALDDAESKLLSEAVTEVASHYNTIIDPKIVAWVGLIGVCGKIYAPRAMAYKLRKSMEKNAPAE